MPEVRSVADMSGGVTVTMEGGGHPHVTDNTLDPIVEEIEAATPSVLSEDSTLTDAIEEHNSEDLITSEMGLYTNVEESSTVLPEDSTLIYATEEQNSEDLMTVEVGLYTSEGNALEIVSNTSDSEVGSGLDLSAVDIGGDEISDAASVHPSGGLTGHDRDVDLVSRNGSLSFANLTTTAAHSGGGVTMGDKDVNVTSRNDSLTHPVKGTEEGIGRGADVHQQSKTNTTVNWLANTNLDWSADTLNTEDQPVDTLLGWPTATQDIKNQTADTLEIESLTTNTPQTENWPTSKQQTQTLPTDTPKTEKLPTDTPDLRYLQTDTSQGEKWPTDTPDSEYLITDTQQTENWLTDTPDSEYLPTDTPEVADQLTDTPEIESLTNTQQTETLPTDTPQTEAWPGDTSVSEYLATDTPQTEAWPTDTLQTQDQSAPSYPDIPQQEPPEETLRITTMGPDFLLEASPTSQSSPDSVDLPRDALFTLGLTITTTREGLRVDYRDVTFDPSQVAKATSYEGSSYPTATRSATVTTTWDKGDISVPVDHQRISNMTDSGRSGSVNDGGSGGGLLGASGQDRSTYRGVTKLLGESDGKPTPPSDIKGEGSGSVGDLSKSTSKYDDLHEGNSSKHSTNEVPVPPLNMLGARNVSEGTPREGSNGIEETLVYEWPVVTRNPGPPVSGSVVVALSVCCALVVVLAALSVALWVVRRHRNRSKVYLSREAAKPRAFFTKPMNPAVLPEESTQEDELYVVEFQRPRAPIMLSDDHKGIYFIKQEDDEGTDDHQGDLGVENRGFSDIPLGEEDRELVLDGGRTRQNPPKYDFKSKRDSDTDSGIRVWSSTGSLHTAASPLASHCLVPPPPYSPSISKESVCLTVHSLPSLPRNSQLLNV